MHSLIPRLRLFVLSLACVGISHAQDTTYKRSDYIQESRWSLTRKSILKSRATKSGAWRDVYTNRMLKNVSDVDVDHVVALSAASRMGARYWAPALKRDFANDTLNLVLTRDSINSSKSDKTPAQWMPIYGRCSYARRWLAVTRKYSLVPTRKDSVVLRTCKVL